MYCKLISYSLNGIEALPICVEIDLNDGLPGFDIVGLPDSSVKEAKERVKSAIKNTGYKFPICHITVNLSPADIKKEGSLYDLPIALGILCCMGEIPPSALEHSFFAGELALDGTLRHIRGLLPILCSLDKSQIKHCIIPTANASEGALIHHLDTKLASTLLDVIAFINKKNILPNPSYISPSPETNDTLDFEDVKGQEALKRGLAIAAAGYHNILLMGPPGSGKTMLAKRLISILPPLTEEECIEVTKIYSVANKLPSTSIMQTRPFRNPHHTITVNGLAGGGINPKPGEISLAHLGILFLDELLEFSKNALEVLREPLEEHVIHLTRGTTSVSYPANFLLITSTNPCPCGYYPDTNKCTCSLPQIKKYLNKLSGPLIDRIDIHLETHTPTLKDIHAPKTSSSKDLFTLVSQALIRQKERFKGTSIKYNSQIPTKYVRTYCKLTPSAQNLLDEWFVKSNSSLRSYDKILKLALTISDFSNAPHIDVPHIAEALQYRLLDRSFW